MVLQRGGGRKPKRDKDAKSQAFWYLQSENSLHSLSLWPQNCTCQLRADPAGSQKKKKRTQNTKLKTPEALLDASLSLQKV